MTEQHRPLYPADDRDRSLDWLTALVPVILISFFYYRWAAVALEVLAVGGYLMAAFLLIRLTGHDRREISLPHALLTGAIGAFCLPAAAPFWLAALLGGAAALLEFSPRIAEKLLHKDVPLDFVFHPAIAAYVIMWLIFPAAGSGYNLPVQWSGVDTVAQATPLTALHGQPTTANAWQMFFGIRAGAIGETCVAAVLLCAAYLIIRRRIRLIAPACMLATVSLLSLVLWHSPLYGVLAGSTVFAALILADRAYSPAALWEQAIVGAVAGGITVWIRAAAPIAEGTAFALLAAELIAILLPCARTGIGRLVTRCRKTDPALPPEENVQEGTEEETETETAPEDVTATEETEAAEDATEAEEKEENPVS